MAIRIDALYEATLKTLTDAGKVEDISKKLWSLKENGERVLFVDEILTEYDLHPKRINIGKSISSSEKFRELGNIHFLKRLDFEALQCYNLALMNAPPGSMPQSIAYANRSALFYSMKRYKECLKDIDTVFSLKYPRRLESKLLDRQKKCREYEPVERSADVSENVLEAMTDMSETNARYPSATANVEVIYNDEMGRHVIAKNDIKVGDIIAIESPYVSLLLRPQALFTCAYCFSRSGNLMPCDTCSFVLYCSEICKNKAHKEYHSVECSLTGNLIPMNFTKLELLALRIVIKARSELPDWNSLLKLIQDTNSNANTEYNGHVNIDGSFVYDSKYYSSIHALSTNIEKRSVSDIFQKSVTAAVFLRLLSGTDFFNDAPDEKGKIVETVAGLLLHHIMTSPTNMHTVSTTIELHAGFFVGEVEIGCAAYAFLSLMNHSCAPNVVRINKLGTNQSTLVALKPLKKGMQLFDNYGYHHALHSRAERQKALKFQYKFDCACEACREDWPPYSNLPLAKNLPADISSLKQSILDMPTIEKLQKADVQVALKTCRALCDLVAIMDDYAPCSELADCQESMKHCLFILYGTVPYGYSREVDWKAVDFNELCVPKSLTFIDIQYQN